MVVTESIKTESHRKPNVLNATDPSIRKSQIRNYRSRNEGDLWKTDALWFNYYKCRNVELNLNDDFNFLAPEINNTFSYMQKCIHLILQCSQCILISILVCFKLTNEKKRTNISFPSTVWIQHQWGIHDQRAKICIIFPKSLNNCFL